MVDSHAHIQMFDDVDDVIQRAFESGIKYILCVGLNPDDSKNVLDIAYRFDDVFAAVGIHPLFVENFSDRDIRLIEDLARDPKVVAIGETGLDFFKGKNEEKQIDFFRLHIHISKILRKPLVVHTRGFTESEKIKGKIKKDVDRIEFSLYSETIDFKNFTLSAFDVAVACIYSDYDDRIPRGVFHCFSWGERELRIARAIGFFVSFSGMITFSKKLKLVVEKTPFDILLTETDSPFLSPRRGERNEPANAKLVIDELAKIKNMNYNKIGEIVADNFRKLFLSS